VSVFSKKFEALLVASPMFNAMAKHAKAATDHANAMSEYVTKVNEHTASLEARVVTLEGQVNVLASTTRSLMETITQLVRGHTTNRNAIEELYNFVTDPAPVEDDDLHASAEQDEPQVTAEEIEAYKKTLN
jgi:hypothetical protein